MPNFKPCFCGHYFSEHFIDLNKEDSDFEHCEVKGCNCKKYEQNYTLFD